MKHTLRSILTCTAIALGLSGTPLAQAAIRLASTRLIYDGKEREATIKVSNVGTTPALVQSWVDTGDANAPPANISVPFTVTPPVGRIDPSKGQTLRVIYTGEPLPQDRESVFWLNLMEVPPKPTGDAAEANTLRLAFRTRVKLFFRPAKLEGEPSEAPGKLRWRLTQTPDQKPALEATNPTPYHVSFSGLELVGGGQTAKFEDGGMVAPGKTQLFPLTGPVASGPGAKVIFHTINDHGLQVEGQTVLGDAPAK